MPPLSREQRAAKAEVKISPPINSKQQVLLDFVLSHCVEVGLKERRKTKLKSLLRLKYRDSIADAAADLGAAIGQAFAGL